MHLYRRRTLCWIIACSAILNTPAWAQSEPFPNKPIKLIVGVPAGATNDLIARGLADYMSKALGQSVIVENKPGAGGNIATLAVSKAPADGYTLLSTGSNIVANLSLLHNPGYSLEKDFSTVGLLQREPALLVVAADSPIKSAVELVSAMKSKSGGANFGSGGIGTPAHITGNAIAKSAGFTAVHVPYRGAAELVNAVISTQVDYAVPTISGALPLVRSGRLRALAVTSEKRSPALPNVPTLSESIMPNFSLIGFVALMAPANTPKEIVQKLSALLTKYAGEPEFAKSAANNGAEPFYFNAIAGSQEFLEAEIPKWRKHVNDSGAKLD